MSIDRAKLEEAIQKARADLGESNPGWKLMPHYKAIVAAAEAHLATLPKTKMVEVWRVEFAQSVACINSGKWEAASASFTSHAEAVGYESVVRSWPNTACVRVTGPHQQEVPV